MTSAKAAYTTKEFTLLFGITERSVQRRALRESWLSRPRQGRGGGNEWLLESMPESTRQAIAAAIASRVAQAEAKKYPAITPKLFTVNTAREIPEHKRERAAARAFVVNMARGFRQAGGNPRTAAYEVFCHEYNRGAVEAPEWVRALLPSVCRKSVTNWEDALDKKGLLGISGRQGQHRIGTGIIDSTPGMADVVIAHIIKFYDVTAEEALDALKVTHKDQPLPSLRSLQRWMKHYRQANERTILKTQNPDAFRSRHQVAFGNRSAEILRLNQLWELDSSPADVQLKDGKRYSLVGGIDVCSRRARLKLARTSNAQAVCSLLRRMFIDFGIPEGVKEDNGAEYRNDRVITALCDLRIAIEFCTPFTPEEKPHIERFFGTFQRHLKTHPGFIGHSVADRKAIESRKSFAERISRKQGRKQGKTDEKPLWELPYTPEEFQRLCDHFCENKYGERKHSSLGMSPNEAAALMAAKTSPRFITDERALDILLLPAPGNDGIRHVGKDGIRVDKGTYIAPELGGIVGDDVQVRLDEDDAGYIYVFDLNGMFVCRAEDPELTGVSRRDIALAAKRFQRTVENQKAKEAKRLVAKTKPQELIPQIIRMQAQEAAENRAERELRFGAEPSREFSTPALEQAALAAASRELAKPAPMTAQEEAARAEFEARYASPKTQPETAQLDLTSCEAFLLYRRLAEKNERREPLTPEQARFFHNYPSTHHYESWKVQYNIYGEKLFDGIELAVAL
jgi:transposase InsO family protein